MRFEDIHEKYLIQHRTTGHYIIRSDWESEEELIKELSRIMKIHTYPVLILNRDTKEVLSRFRPKK